MAKKKKKQTEVKARNWLAVNAWNRGHGVEPDKKKYSRRKKHRHRSDGAFSFLASWSAG